MEPSSPIGKGNKTVSEQGTTPRTESRWPAIIAILSVVTILEFLPLRLRVMPVWFPEATAIILLAPLLSAALRHKPYVARIERVVIYCFVLLCIILMILTLERLIDDILIPAHGKIGGVALLASAAAIWIVNVIAFALLYWQVDRGGPDLRASDQAKPPDIKFPDSPSAGSRRYAFTDYLFYAYTVSTAFSPTEMFPDSTRMKMLMMLQSTISLATIIIVAGRAINLLK